MRLAAIATALALTQSLAPSQAAQVVRIAVTATDRSGEAVRDLAASDFTLLDNGSPTQIVRIERGDTPVALSVVFDLSNDLFLQAPRLLEAAPGLRQAVLLDGGPMMTFLSRHWRPGAEWRAASSRLVNDLRRLGIQRAPYNGRSLWSECEWVVSALAFREGRRVLVVVTDGQGSGGWARPDSTRGNPDFDFDVDPVPDTSARRLLEFLDLNDVLVHAISFEGSRFDDTVRQAAERSGGTVTILPRDADLGPTFDRIARELPSQYILGFTPASFDDKVHKLEVRVMREGVSIRAPHEYSARSRATSI